MMAQFPLVLAIEPRLLPLARLNGFNMDRKVSSSRSHLLRTVDDVGMAVSKLRLPQDV